MQKKCRLPTGTCDVMEIAPEEKPEAEKKGSTGLEPVDEGCPKPATAHAFRGSASESGHFQSTGWFSQSRLSPKYRTDRSPVEGSGLVKRGQEGPLAGDARAVRRVRVEAVQALWAHAGPNGPARQQAAGVWASRSRWVLGAQHHALWGGPCAGASFAGREGNARCSTMARPPPGAVRYASTLLRPPHREQAKTSSAFRPA